MTQAGKLDTRITIQRDAGGTDAQGSVTQSWSARATVWANARAVPSMTTQERMGETERYGSADYVFTIRWQSLLANLSTSDRIQWGGDSFEILSVFPMPEGRPDRIQITARSRA
jgi:SPP1 family predicted phage head-tail adaptor